MTRAGAVAPDLADRTLTAEQAARLVRPGQRVFVGSACATPRTLLRALEELPDPPAGVTLVHSLTDRMGVGDPPRTHYRPPRLLRRRRRP
jgi:acyl-CoA hydrolase